ncbi:MAG: hypothetical protein A4E48_02192 [Methanosaeta sp. PtaU1.Bin060]|nr:MAG: hypothetical protein A4E48_02192 [Methanosaeta sp. PtaU1.Bin060]
MSAAATKRSNNKVESLTSGLGVLSLSILFYTSCHAAQPKGARPYHPFSRAVAALKQRAEEALLTVITLAKLVAPGLNPSG